MVVLAAAAAGAAGYGVFKGGEAGVQKGKEYQKEIKLEKKRFGQLVGLREKTKNRSSRIAEIVQMKKSGGGTTTTAPVRTSFVERQLAEKEAGSDINDRHRAVMQKLRSGRQDEKRKSSSSKLSSLNPFKKK